MRSRYYCVWMHNRTSSKDDEPIKVRASSKDEASQIAKGYQPNRFTVGQAYTLSEFTKETKWPHKWATKWRCK
jgi:hypothetical protein